MTLEDRFASEAPVEPAPLGTPPDGDTATAGVPETDADLDTDGDALPGDGFGEPTPDGAEAADEPSAEEGAREGKDDDDGSEPARPREGPASLTGRIVVGAAQGEHVTIAETVQIGDFRTRAPERLTGKHCESLDLRSLARRLRGMEWPPETLRPLEEHAGRSRFLILSGESGLGKGALALALAERLLRRRPGPRRALLAGRPSRDLQVDLARLAREQEESVLVFEDAFVHDNASLCRLVEELDTHRLRSLDESLGAAGCWVLLTTNPESLPGDATRLDGLEVRLPLAQPPLAELRRCLHRLAQLRLGGDGCGDEDRAAVERLLDGSADAICERLRTLPRISAFVEGYLLTASHGRIEWEAAADRLDGLADWLFEELPEDPAAWSFALALTLAGAVPALGDPQLFAFDALWRQLDGALREELAGEAAPARPLAALGVGERLLRRTRSEIAGSRPPTVRFRDPETSERLWRALLDGPGRQVAGLLVGWLRPMLEADDPFLRETAARALGRLGVLEPAHVALPLVERWVRGGDSRCSDGTLGGLLQGAHASGDDDYRRAALRRLSAAVDRRKTASWIGRAAALRDLGEVDLGLAMDELRLAFADEARVLVERLWRAHQETYRKLDRMAAQRAGKVSDPVRRRLFADAVERHVPKRAEEAFRAFRYGLTGLGLIRDPVDVLDRLRPWLAASVEDETAGRPAAWAGATALALLSEHGVLHLWEERPISLPIGAEGGDFAFSRLILAVAAGDEAAARLAEALADALAACSHLPPPLARVLHANWRSFLVRWGGAVERCDSFDEAYDQLLRRLLPLTIGNAGEETFRLLQGEACFQGDDGRLGRFATNVLAG